MIHSTLNHQKIPFSDPTHLFDDIILERSPGQKGDRPSPPLPILLDMLTLLETEGRLHPLSLDFQALLRPFRVVTWLMELRYWRKSFLSIVFSSIISLFYFQNKTSFLLCISLINRRSHLLFRPRPEFRLEFWWLNLMQFCPLTKILTGKVKKI